MVNSNRRFVTGSAGAACFAMLVGYCQLLIGETGVPLERSLGWATTTLASWISFAALVWRFRNWMIRRVDRATIREMASAVALVFGFAVAVLALSTIAWAMVGFCPLWLAAITRRLLNLAPMLLVVAVAVTAIFAAYRYRSVLAHRLYDHRAAPSPRPRIDWIELPEAPLLRLRPEDVSVVRTARNYCELKVGGRDILVRITAKRLEQRLEPFGFVRIHRGAIVNLARVRNMQPDRSGRLMLLMDDGDQLAVSRAYRRQVRGRLGGAQQQQISGHSFQNEHLASLPGAL